MVDLNSSKQPLDDSVMNMKNSDVSWIGSIPFSWEVGKLKNLFSIYNGSTPKSTVTEYWSGDINWITPADMSADEKYIDSGVNKISDEGYESANLTIVPAGSLILSSRAPIGLVNVATSPMCTNQGCKSLVPRDGVDSSFYYYYLYCQTESLNSFGHGTTFMELSTSDLKNYTVPIPPYEDQVQISKFLDTSCDEIHKLQKTLKQYAAKYVELKQSIITNAVFGGLEDTSKKDSGVSWISQIPSTWDLVQLRHLVKVSNEKISNFEDYLALENVEGWTGKFIPTDTPISEEDSIAIHKGDLCFSKLRPYLAKAIIAPFDGACSSEFIVIREFKGNVEYLKYLMLTNSFIDEVNSNTYGTKMPRASWDFIKSIKIPNISIENQNIIVDYLDDSCSLIDSLLSIITDIISSLSEYKMSLIYECVTGKYEVGGI